MASVTNFAWARHWCAQWKAKRIALDPVSGVRQRTFERVGPLCSDFETGPKTQNQGRGATQNPKPGPLRGPEPKTRAVTCPLQDVYHILIRDRWVDTTKQAVHIQPVNSPYKRPVSYCSHAQFNKLVYHASKGHNSKTKKTRT